MAGNNTGGRNRAAAFLAMSVVAAVGATAMIYNVMQSLQHELDIAQQRAQTFKVVAAKTTLYPGDTVRAEDLEYVELEQEFVPDNTFDDIAKVVGRVPLERVLDHDLVRIERLADEDAGQGMPALIPPGMRAISLKITDASAVGGFLNPGNFVDVLVTIDSANKDKKAERMTRTVLNAVKLLAVNASMGGNEQADTRYKVPSVTLALTPKDAELAAHSLAQGRVTLTLRNDIDAEQPVLEATTLSKLIGTSSTELGAIEPTEQARRKGLQTILKVDAAPPAKTNAPPRYIRGTNVQGG